MTEAREKVKSSADGFAHQAVEDAVARERARIARELHDGIATDLAGAISLFKVYMEGRKAQPDQNLKNVFEIMERLLKHVREALDTVAPIGAETIDPRGVRVAREQPYIRCHQHNAIVVCRRRDQFCGDGIAVAVDREVRHPARPLHRPQERLCG